MPNWALLLVRFALCTFAAAIFVWIGHALNPKAGGWLGFLLSAPLYGSALAKPIVELFEEGFTWLARQPLRQWEGRYYEFDGIQVRIYEDDDKLWFVANDVVRATGMAAMPQSFLATQGQGIRVLEGTKLQCLDLDTVEKLLSRNRERDAGRFMSWARREVEAPWERKRSP